MARCRFSSIYPSPPPTIGRRPVLTGSRLSWTDSAAMASRFFFRAYATGRSFPCLRATPPAQSHTSARPVTAPLSGERLCLSVNSRGWLYSSSFWLWGAKTRSLAAAASEQNTIGYTADQIQVGGHPFSKEWTELPGPAFRRQGRGG